MIKKNILGMDMLEWKHLSGLADPYTLALAEVGAKAGVPPVVIKEDDDDNTGLDAAQAQNKQARLISIKKAARNLRGKTRNAAEKAATTPAKDRYKTTLELAKHRKAFVKEGLDEELMWAVFLEDRGSSAEEFGQLLDIAIESDDEDMAIELLSIEDQLDELLGAAPKAAVNGALAAGKVMAKGAQAVAGKMMQKPMVAPAAPVAGGGAPAGATPMAGAAPTAPMGASPVAAPAAPAMAATAAAAPATGSPAGTAGAPKKIGLLGTLGRGLSKPMAKPPMAKPAATPAPKKEDVDEWEEYLSSEFEITAEQYIEMVEEALETNDTDMLGSVQQIDEIFAAWRAKKNAAAADKHEKGMKAVRDAVNTIKGFGADNVAKANKSGRAVGAPKVAAGSGTSVHAKKESVDVADIAAQIMESNQRESDDVEQDMKSVIADQLQFSGYSDEYIEARSKTQQLAGQRAMAARSGKVPFKLPSKDGSVQNVRQTMKYGSKGTMMADKLKNRETSKLVRSKK